MAIFHKLSRENHIILATAPIITIAWQQPARWVGVEEHVRRGRIRNRGELTAGMTVQVMYKKGWYKAKVINPDRKYLLYITTSAIAFVHNADRHVLEYSYGPLHGIC